MAQKRPHEGIEVTEAKLEDLTADDKNANKHSARGMAQLDHSMSQFGFLEAGVLDKNNNIVGGNARSEIAASLGMDDVLIVDVDGTRPVYLRHKRLDLNTPEGRQAAIALNRVAEVNIDLDPAVLLQLAEEGVDITPFYSEYEIGELEKEVAEAANLAAAATGEAPATPAVPPGNYKEQYGVIVICAEESEQECVYNRLTEMGLNCKVVNT